MWKKSRGLNTFQMHCTDGNKINAGWGYIIKGKSGDISRARGSAQVGEVEALLEATRLSPLLKGEDQGAAW